AKAAEPDADPMRAQVGPVQRSRLLERHRAVAAVAYFEIDAEGVDACGLEPLLRPRAQVPSRRLFECAEERVEVGVAVSVAREIRADALDEWFLSDPRDQLLQDRRTLGVADAVEVGARGFGIGGIRNDGMGRWLLVLHHRPE